MKKTLTALVAATLIVPAAFASAGTTTPSAPHSSIDLPCVQTAVDAREATIGDAFTAFASAETSALSARKSALHDAWGMTDASARKAARTKAWNDYRVANKAAYTALRSAKRAAWATFATASASCKVPVVESASSEGVGSLGL